MSICFIGACANREENQQAHESETQIPVEQANQHDNGTAMEQTEVLQQIKDQIQADFTIKNANNFTYYTGFFFLSATTRTEGNQVEIVFYESKESMPINDIRLKKSANVIARLLVKQYNNAEGASTQIAFDNFNQNGGQKSGSW
ncbi:hypothetical protein OL548_02845 [Lysinibacillus sp. MHQ-1]|nr:hypothetical protein OL548_02845 [Lysinibacillus sp. MHQ-1]